MKFYCQLFAQFAYLLPTSILMCSLFSLSLPHRSSLFLLNLCVILLNVSLLSGNTSRAWDKMCLDISPQAPATRGILQGHLQQCTAGVGGLGWFKFGKPICVGHLINWETASAEWHGHLKGCPGNKLLRDCFSVGGNCVHLESAAHSI